jgi:multidrug resistance efflux pump
MAMTFLRKTSVFWMTTAAVLLLGAALVIVTCVDSHGSPSWFTGSARAADSEADDTDNTVTVKTVHPRHDPSFSVSIEQPAFVAPYYLAELMAKVAGPVKPTGIVHEVGDRVKAGDVLVQIDVPDMQEDVLQREAVVKQRRSQWDLAQANLKMAEAGVEAAAEMIKVKQSEVDRAKASRNFREKELRRFTGLASGPNPGVFKDIVDEKTEYYEAAVANVATALAAVQDAQAEWKKAQAKLEAARADVKVEEAMVGVARKDRDKAQALLDFATLRAPFDGVITRRNVDPGTFVQNATTAHAEPLLTVVRDDIVTVYMKVPDKFAPYVNRDTEAIIQMDTLPGLVLRGKVTRYAPSLENAEHDRTMRVEVDLYNGSYEEFKVFLAREKTGGNSDLKSKTLPIFPKVEGKDVQDTPLRLMPGQYGKMRLVLRSYPKAYLLPRSAVISQGGTSYVFVVKDGRALKLPVEVQADNGEELKVAVVELRRGQEVRRELTSDEEVVYSNQGELSNGQAVKTTHIDW